MKIITKQVNDNCVLLTIETKKNIFEFYSYKIRDLFLKHETANKIFTQEHGFETVFIDKIKTVKELKNPLVLRRIKKQTYIVNNILVNDDFIFSILMQNNVNPLLIDKNALEQNFELPFIENYQNYIGRYIEENVKQILNNFKF